MPLLPRNRTTRWLLIFAVTAGALLVGYSLWAMFAANSFAGRIEAIRAAGDPATLADLAPNPIAKEDDAAAHLAAIDSQLDSFSRDYGHFLEKTTLGKDYEAAVDAGEAPLPEQIESIRSILAKYAGIDAAINEAAACEQYASTLDFSLPHQQFLAAALNSWGDLRTVARFAVWQMEVAVADGDYDEAVNQGVQLLRLAQLHNAEPCITASLIGFAVRGVAAQKIYESLSAGPVSVDTRERLNAELARFEDEPGLVYTLKSERALNISGVQDNFGGLRGLLVGWPRSASSELLDYYEQILPLARMSWHEVQTTPSAKRALEGGQGGFVSLVLPAMEAWLVAANRTTAIMRSLRVCNKLPTQGASHEPVDLNRLGLPKEATLDPFSGESLKVRRTDNGWSVYSIGKDGKNDGGSVHDAEDYGVGPRGEEE